MGKNIGLSKTVRTDSTEAVKEEEGWGDIIAIFLNRGIPLTEILKMPCPFVFAIIPKLHSIKAYPVVIPYLGDGSEKEDEITPPKHEWKKPENKIDTSDPQAMASFLNQFG